VVIYLENILFTLDLDAGSGTVRDGYLLHARWPLFFVEWVACAHGSFLWQLVCQKEGVFFLVFYLGIMLYGALGSTAYSLGYWGSEPLAFFTGLLTGAEEVGRMERSSTAWRPFIWPIKAIMITGLLLMLLQAFSELCKDIARLRGYDLPGVER